MVTKSRTTASVYSNIRSDLTRLVGTKRCNAAASAVPTHASYRALSVPKYILLGFISQISVTLIVFFVKSTLKSTEPTNREVRSSYVKAKKKKKKKLNMHG
jgi:hypothetical protein